MTWKRRIFVAGSVILAALGVTQLATGFFFSPQPHAWKLVQPGMSRDEVISALGRPAFDTYELKGQDTWWRRALLNERRFVVRYDEAQTVVRVGEAFHWRGRVE
jgi:hypothetical protein